MVDTTLTQNDSEPPRAEIQVQIRYTRRLSDKILMSFHQACDQNDFDVARDLLKILEGMVAREPNIKSENRRKGVESLVAAHERLWHLRHPKQYDDL